MRGLPSFLPSPSTGETHDRPIELADLAPILTDLNLAAPTALTPLLGGSSAAFHVALADDTAVVLKTYPGHVTAPPVNERYVAGLLADFYMPTTRYLLLDGSRTRLPIDFAITNYLPGRRVVTFADEPDVSDLHRQMGALLRRLHAIRLRGYGHLEADGPNGTRTHAEWLADFAAGAFRQFRHYGADPNLATRLEAVFAARRSVIAEGSGPVLAHNDLNPNNVLAERGADGRLHLTGLIDFGSAISADTLCDLAKTVFICEHEAPGSRAAILAGYGPIDHPDPEAALWLYTLLHRVIMWWWLRMIGAIPDGQPHDLIDALTTMADEANA